VFPGPVSARDKAEIEQRIKTWLARQIWRMEGYYEVSNQYDTMVQRGLEKLQ
jgi:carboxyl-terminal processing protease